MINIEDLKSELPYKWRVQSTNKGGAMCVAYIDSRQLADRLDQVVGPLNWQSDYRVINDNLYAGIAIYDAEKNHWVWKWDCGIESNTEKEKGEASGAFKRAGVKWGVGRFLYDLEIQKVKTKEYGANKKMYPCDDRGEILWDGNALTNYINNRNKKPTKAPTPARMEQSKKYETPTSEPTYNKTPYSEELIKRIKTISKDGLTGKDCLKKFLPDFNKEKNTTYTSLTELDSEDKLKQLVDYIENKPPKSFN